MKNLSRKERADLSEQFFGINSVYHIPAVNVTNRIELIRALHNSGLLPLLIKNGIIRIHYDQWLRWYDLYQQLSEGTTRKNGARDLVFRFFDQYYTDHPELEEKITFDTIDHMQRFMKKPLIR